MQQSRCAHRPPRKRQKEETMSTLMQASHEWASRPEDQRFTSLDAMLDKMTYVRERSRSVVVSSRVIEAHPMDDHKGLQITGPNGHAYSPTNWSFGQLAQLAEAPAGFLRTLPAEIAADCINFGLRFKRGPEDVGVLLYKDGEPIMRAATGPAYGRIWNADIVKSLVNHVGDGINGQWRVPGEFGKVVEITKDNTTLYASDRDMFVFLADEDHRIEMPNRRNGQPGSLARGFFVWNSEVGKTKMGIATFLFDYVCCNRIVWGAEGYKEIGIRHTASAPDKWLEQVEPALIEYSRSSESSTLDLIKSAQAKKIDDLDAFLNARFGKREVVAIKQTHQDEEGRPIESLWDATTAVTAYARQIPHQDQRVEMEREGGNILSLVVG